MNKVSVSNIDDSGSAVVVLQEALLALLERGELLADDPANRDDLSSRLRAEVTELHYAGITTKLVATFQLENSIEPSGSVDAATADALNDGLTKLGLLDEHDPTGDRTVRGVTKNMGYRHWTGVAVISAVLIVVTIGYIQGDMVLAAIFLVILGLMFGLVLWLTRPSLGAGAGGTTSGGGSGRPGLPGGKELLVRGTVTHAGGLLAVDVAVQAYDRDMRAEELLGTTRTDAKGNYTIRYAHTQFLRSEKSAADLLVRVVDDTGDAIATSKTFFNAASDQTINITLKASQGQTLSEYERYLTELKPLIGTVDGAALTDEDLEFLAGETDIELDHLSLLRLDAQWQELHDVADAAFYGLLRKGAPTTLRQLLAQKSTRLRELLSQALAENLVPSQLGERLDDTAERLSELAVENASKQEEGEVVAPLGSVVETAAVSLSQQQQFVRMTLDHEPNPSTDFWQEVLAELGDAAAVREVQRSLQASVLTLHHLPVLKQVQQETQGQSVKAVAGWSETEWLEVVNRAKVHGTEVPTTFENAEDYASAIVKKVDAYLPSDRLVARATRAAGGLHLTEDSPLLKLYGHLGFDQVLATPGLSDSQRSEAVQRKLQLFDSLFQQNPALDLRCADLVMGRMLVQGEETDLEWGGIPETDRPQILKQAQAFQRVLPLADKTETRIKLLSAGFDSGHVVLGTSVDQLAHEAQLTNEEAVQVRSAASHRAVGVEFFRSGWSEVLFGTRLAVDNVDRTVPASFREIDDIQEMFGAQNFCECAHCSSVLSQSAYFVDLMAFVDKHISQKTSVFGAQSRASALYLPKRRPDLWSLELSCDNIQTQVPYLEVVNHTFEQFLIDHMSLASSDDLYEQLANETEYSTFWQPFLPAQRELDLYLSHFGLKRADVFAALNQPVALQRLAHLSVSQSELEIMAEPNADNAHMRRLFRVEGTGRGPVRIPVPQFMRATGLSREEVTHLLEAPTLYPIVFQVVSTEVEDSLGQLFEEEELVANDALQAINRLDVIHRWVRLWRKTDWSLIDFDFVLSNLPSARITDATVHRIADLKLLQDRLDLNIEELVSLVHEIPAPSDPLFDGRPDPSTPFLAAHGAMLHRLFGDDPWTDEVTFTDFESNAPTATFTNSTDSDTSDTSDVYRVLAGLSLNESELITLLVDLRHELETDLSGADRTMALTVPNLSVLYRHALLARKLKRSTAELFPLIRLLLGADRTSVGPLEEMLQLSIQLPELDALPFSLSELRWLVMDEWSDDIGLVATDEQLAQLLDPLFDSRSFGNKP